MLKNIYISRNLHNVMLTLHKTICYLTSIQLVLPSIVKHINDRTIFYWIISTFIVNGVIPEQAQERINSLTNDEAKIFAQRFKELPIGGIGAVTAILIIVLLFIALDLSGKTDVFKGVGN